MANDLNKKRPPESSKKHRMDCAQIRELLFAYMTHDLGDTQTLVVREHLRHCPDCATEAQKILEVVNFMKLHDPAESAPKRFEAKKRKRLIWLMEHPFVARCLKYHKTTAFIIMVILLVLTLVLLLSVRFYNEKISALPPVRLEHSEDEKIPEPLETVKPYDEPGVDEIPGIGGLE